MHNSRRRFETCRDARAREDFFSYLILFKHGGVYATIDCTCERALCDLITPKDDFVAGHQPKIESRILSKHVCFPLLNLPV